MSSVKYDEVACENVALNLENINSLLSEVSSELERLIDALPTVDKIDNRIIRLSTKTRTNEDETTEEYIDSGTKRYYENNYKSPIVTAKNNLITSKSNVISINDTVSEIDDKVRAIQKLVTDYEDKSIEQRDVGGLTGGSSSGVATAVSTMITEATVGNGKVELNKDVDGDGKPDLNIDKNGDGKADLNIDADNDGKPDLNIDTTGDGKADLNIDVDNDGKPDLNIDKNGDGKADLNIDTNGDGKPNLNVDLDGNGTADLNIDTNADGKPDLNIDINGDGKADLNIDTDSDGKPDKNIDADGDGKVDPIKPAKKPADSEDENKKEKIPATPSDNGSDLFDEDKADNSEDGFADNIVAGVVGTVIGEGGEATDLNNETGSLMGLGANVKDTEDGEGVLFPFLPGSSSTDGENSDFLYRGLYDQSDDVSLNMNQIKYDSISEDSSSIAKSAAIAGAVGLGVSGVDAAATINEARKKSIEDVTVDEKEDKKLVRTIVSSSILCLVSVGYILVLFMSKPSVLAIILLGGAMAVSSITATSGLKFGKYIGFGSILFVSLLTFILASCGIVTPIGYVVVYAIFVVLSIAAFLLDLMKGMFEDKIDLLPVIVTLAVGLFFGMLKVLNVINSLLFVILNLLIIGVYFLWEKVIKYKLPDDEDDEIVDNVIYKPVQYTENSPMNNLEPVKFDPRDLYKEDDKTQPFLENGNDNDNPFANFNYRDNDFNNKNDNNNGMF